MMRYGWYAPNQQQQYGWDKTSDEYRSHLSKMERTTSILPDVPHFPSLHKAFNNRYTYGEEKESTTTEPEVQHQKKAPAKAQKKVQVSERVEIVETAPEINNDESSSEVGEESIDTKADGFIQRKRRGFELCKWKTFKVH